MIIKIITKINMRLYDLFSILKKEVKLIKVNKKENEKGIVIKPLEKEKKDEAFEEEEESEDEEKNEEDSSEKENAHEDLREFMITIPKEEKNNGI